MNDNRFNIQRFRAFELFGISITEILLLFVISLIVYTHFAEQESQLEVSIKDKQIEELERQLSSALDQVSLLEDKNKALQHKIRDLERELSDLRQQYRELANVIREYLVPEAPLTPKNVAKAFEDYGLESNKNAKTRLDLIREIARLQALVTELETIIAELEKQIDFVEGAREALEGKLKGLGKGTDHPRCRAPGASYTISHLYTVVVRSDGYLFEASWPASEDHLYHRISGVAEIGRRKVLTEGELKAFGGEIWKWGNRQDPVCRFFANIYPSKAVNTEYFLRVRKIERYFYKIENLKLYKAR